MSHGESSTITTPPTPSWRTHLRRPSLLTLVAAAPLIVAAVALAQRPWAPTLDLAMTELRVRDVGGTHTPLIGLPGRIGTFPDSQGSHPGPASFYLLAIVYRLAGASPWALELGSIAVNAAAIAVLVLIGRRLAGSTGALALGAIAAVAVRGYGLNVLTHPWNPYLPVMLWLVVLAAAWTVVAGHPRAVIVVVAVGSVAAQTHVPYLANVLAIVALVAVALARQWRRQPEARRAIARAAVLAVAVGGVVWLPPLIDQLRHDPGNARLLLRHFTGDPPEPAVGAADAARVFLRHLDVVSATFDLIVRPDAFVYRSGLESSTWWIGLIVLATWIACAVIAARRELELLNALNVVLAVALVAGAASISRIFGKVWYYLTLWAWGTTLLVTLSIGWTVITLARDHGRARVVPMVHAAVAALGLAATAASIGAAVVLDVPETQMSDALRAVVPDTVTALDAGIGPAAGRDATYVVFWQDAAFNGAQGYGLLNELERQGLDVGVHPTWRTPATEHRVVLPGYDAEIHLVSGVFIDEWRTRPDYHEVAWHDRRSPAERARFDELRQRVLDRLAELGRDDLVERVDRNLFGASLDPDLPRDVVDDLSEMLLLAVPIAVFIAPAGSSS